jgi:hypothetical protein
MSVLWQIDTEGGLVKATILRLNHIWTMTA